MRVQTPHDVIVATWRSEAARVVGALVRIVRNVGLAEELAQDAFVAALEEWPRSGIPERPGAWLMTTARNRALNTLKRAQMTDRKLEALAHEGPGHVSLAELEEALSTTMDDRVTDDVLRLLFIACHPMLAREARVALTLRLVGGLTTDEIARAFLVPEPTVAQRIVRAKRALAEADVAFELPPASELGARLSSVLEVVYLVFNEGYAATAGDDVMRPALVGEARRLGRSLVELAPSEPEVLGLAALMELQASRMEARTDAAGEPVLLVDQDRSRWDAEMITRGLALLDRPTAPAQDGPYRIQASIAACHARTRRFEETDWKRIAALYESLLVVAPSPIVALNHAMAVSRAESAQAGLVLVDALAKEPALARYHLLPSARADLLDRLGRSAEASDAYERAAALAENSIQRGRLLLLAAKARARSRA